MNTTPQSAQPTAAELARRDQRRDIFRLAAWFVLVPTIATIVYYAVIAPPEYESRTEFTIRGRIKPAPDLLAGLGLPASGNAENDPHIVIDYLQSPPTIELLRARYGFDQAYSRFSLDPSAYLSPKAPVERVVRYWGHRLKAQYDGGGDTVTVSVRAYRPADALALARGVIDASGKVVDDLNNRVSESSMTQANAQVAAAKRDYDVAKDRLSKLQGNVNALTLDAKTKEAIAEVGQIDIALATLKVSQGTVAATFQPDAPQARAVHTQIALLEAAREKAIAEAQTAPGEPAAAHDVMIQAAILDYQFAQRAYLAASEALVAARPQSQNRNFVVAFVPPRLPEQSNYWKRFLNVIAVFLGSSLLFGVGALSYSVIKDHIQ